MKTNKICLLIAASFLLIGCGGKKGSSSSADGSSSSEGSSSSSGGSSYDNQLGPAPTYEEDSISIHYHREDGAYTNKWDLWMWDLKDNDGKQYVFNGIDDFGAVAAYPLSTWSDAMNDGLGIIIRTFNAWSKQTPDIKLQLGDYEKDTNGIYHLYFEQGENDIYDGNIYRTSNTEGISVAEFGNETSVKVVGSKEIASAVLKEDGVQIASKVLETPAKSLRINLPEGKTASFESSYTVEATFAASGETKSKGVSVNKLYTTDTFKNNYTYTGNDLGAIRTPTSTTFKVWSPVSSDIKVRLYESGTPKSVDSVKGDDTYDEIPMIRGEKGVWTASVSSDLAGKYYTYVVTNNTFNKVEVVDPYAKSAGVSGLRGMIVDFDKTNPEGWDDVNFLDYNRNALTVYEMHVADVTSSNSWTGKNNSENKRKFLGLCESGTIYSRSGKTVKTGFDHIKEFGVNAIQLLPIYDQANDETKYTFNWGYNPLNYNVVEGMYSSNPYDGYARINELKQVVQEYNKAGIEVIMDVVYNHVSGASGSNFDVLMPGYYYRYTSAGALSNGSGCGNETASDMPMMRKFMIDSTAYWMKEFKLGGFRFDLMGLHDLETMNQLVANLKTINSHAVVYGEPWTGGTSTLPDALSAKQVNGNKYEGYGQFNDQMRDALIKGGLNDKSAKGWITNSNSVNMNDVTAIQKGIKGSTYSSSVEIADPNKTVNYVTCHDNYTIYDRIIAANAAKTEAEAAKMATLSEAVVFLSQGTAFMQGGEEFLRTKNLDHNSYESGDGVNQFKYNQLISYEGIDMTSYYDNFKKLISLKQQIAGLHSSTCDISVTSLDNGSTLKYEIGNYMIIHSNGVGTKGAISLGGNYQVVLDTLGVNAVDSSLSSVTPEAYQTLVLVK